MRGFANCSSLRSVYIPANVKRICNSAFDNCTALEAVTIAGKEARIDEQAFDGCSPAIYGLRGSTAQKYAKAHGLQFFPIRQEGDAIVPDGLLDRFRGGRN